MNDETKLAAYEIYWRLENTHLAAKWQSIWWDVDDIFRRERHDIWWWLLQVC